MFLARFELVVAHFGHPKIDKCLEKGLHWDHQRVKNSLKCVFAKEILEHFSETNNPILSPSYAFFGPSRVTKCLENEVFWDSKWVQKEMRLFGSHFELFGHV